VRVVLFQVFDNHCSSHLSCWQHRCRTHPLFLRGIVGGKFWLNCLRKSYVVSHEQDKASANLSWSSSSSKEQSCGWENHQTRDHEVYHCILDREAMRVEPTRCWLCCADFKSECKPEDRELAHIKTMHYRLQEELSHIYCYLYLNLNPIFLRYLYLLFIFCVLTSLTLHSQGLF
jgi:hypothetical protein